MPKGHILTQKDDSRGRKKIAKMYISDFNQDGLLEILFWHRQYYSTLMSDKDRVGFIFEKEWYSYYVEDYGSDGFKPQAIDAATAKGLLATQQLTWSQGYPDNHLCYEKENFGYANGSMLRRVLDDTLK